MESSFYVGNTSLNDRVIKRTKMDGQILIFEYSIGVTWETYLKKKQVFLIGMTSNYLPKIMASYFELN